MKAALDRWIAQHPNLQRWLRRAETWVRAGFALLLAAGFLWSLRRAITTHEAFWMGASELTLIGFSVYLLFLQIRKQHEWNRRKASHDFLSNLISGGVAELRTKLESEFGVDTRNTNQTYTTVYNSISEEARKKEFYQTTYRLFNFFEQVGIGIKDHMLDEEICFDALHNIVIDYKRWGEPLIEERREGGREATWTEFEYYAEKWRGPSKEHQKRAAKRREESRRRALEDGRLAPKSKL